ncbi:MAG: hypothetical protein ACYC0V_08815 [Armatimonadota bacterium]
MENIEMKVGICSRIVAFFSTWWTWIGWFLFACFAFLVIGFAGGIIPAAVSLLLLVVWWVIDAIDQAVSRWQIVLGILMPIIVFIPRGAFIFGTAWVMYWFKIRE